MYDLNSKNASNNKRQTTASSDDDDQKCNEKEDVCVHRGFYNQLTSNNNHDKLTTKVKELLKEHPDYNIYVCGHSLGGALCTLYGYMLSTKNHSHTSTITYCC